MLTQTTTSQNRLGMDRLGMNWLGKNCPENGLPRKWPVPKSVQAVHVSRACRKHLNEPCHPAQIGQ